MMGLERLFRGLYGTRPQLDMDKQFARVRVPEPMTLDFFQLADGIRRNNVGTAAITVEAVCSVKDGKVTLDKTGQSFPLEGAPPADPGSARRAFLVQDWAEPAKTKVRIASP